MVSLRLAACAFLGLSGCATIVPGPSGAHGIGTTHFELSEPGYSDPYAPAPTPRRIPVQAWYPAQAADGGARELYLDDALVAGLAELTGAPKFLLPQNPSRSVVDAPAVPGRYPVLVFNHGLGSFQKQSASLMEELASHGYVVLSVGHPFDSLVVQYADGSVVRQRRDLPAWRAIEAATKNLGAVSREVEPLLVQARAAQDPQALREAMGALAKHSTYEPLAAVLEVWAHDTRVVLDNLGRLDDGGVVTPLRGIVDKERVGAFGHSLGGILAGQLAMTDPRVHAGMNFDAAQLPAAPDAPYRLAAPFCFLYADTTKVGGVAVTNDAMNDALLAEAPSGSCGASLRGASHLNFTDMNNSRMMASALGVIDPAEMAKLLRGMAVGFFDHHLRGTPLTGFTPSATLRVRWAPSRPCGATPNQVR
jgi:predicted dienelactone hydrolase